MSAVFKPDETFRDDFTFRNSPEAIRRFPLPFVEDQYMYSVNIEPHMPGRRARWSNSPSTWTSTTLPNAASGRWCSTPSRCATRRCRT